MTVAERPWLWRIYLLALVMHGLLLAFLLFGAVLLARSFFGTANAAHPDILFALLSFASSLGPVLVPLLPLVSFVLLRRRGQWPSPSHQMLVVIGAVLLFGLFLALGALT